MMPKPILCLDFDGVLHAHLTYGETMADIPGPPVDGAMAFVLAAREHFTLAVFSYRSRRWGARRAMRSWLLRHLTEHLGGRSEEARRVVAEVQWPWFKPAAAVTLDDRALTFRGTWPGLDDLLAFRPWNRPGD